MVIAKLINSTLAKDDGRIYFKSAKDYLERKGITSEILVPHTWNIKEYQNSLEQQLIPGDVYYLVGHSFGADVAINAALNHPREVKKVVLIDEALEWGYQSVQDKISAEILCSLPSSLKEWLGSSDYLVRELLKGMVKHVDEDMFEELVREVKRQGGCWNINAICSGREYIRPQDSAKKLEELVDSGVGVDFIYASDSVKEYLTMCGIPIILGSESMHKIDDCGHLIMLEKEDEFNQLLYNILCQ